MNQKFTRTQFKQEIHKILRKVLSKIINFTFSKSYFSIQYFYLYLKIIRVSDAQTNKKLTRAYITTFIINQTKTIISKLHFLLLQLTRVYITTFIINKFKTIIFKIDFLLLL